MKNINTLQTPCYLLDINELDYNLNGIKAAFINHWSSNLCIGYSVKTNHLKWILEYMNNQGIYSEVVSKDEYKYSELIGFSPSNIIFNGPYKDKNILQYAISNGSIVNIDSFSEIYALKDISNKESIKIGLRVNFNLENDCPNETAMGDKPSRFGFCVENGEFERALNMCSNFNIKVIGLHMHQSTKTRSNKVFKALAQKAAQCINIYNLKENLKYIDIGGGFFGGRNVTNKPTFDDYAYTICKELSKVVSPQNTLLIIEPGASVIATPISYITKVIDIKNVRGNRIITVDGSKLHIDPLFRKPKPSYKIYSNGPLCEETQTICGSTCMEDDRLLYIDNAEKLEIGDIIEIKKCGSYTMSYNSCFINLPPAVYIKQNEDYKIVRNKWNPKNIL